MPEAETAEISNVLFPRHPIGKADSAAPWRWGGGSAGQGVQLEKHTPPIQKLNLEGWTLSVVEYHDYIIHIPL